MTEFSKLQEERYNFLVSPLTSYFFGSCYNHPASLNTSVFIQIDHGASPDCRDDEEMTPLTRAVEQGACTAAEFLFEDGKQFSKRKSNAINQAFRLQSVNKN